MTLISTPVPADATVCFWLGDPNNPLCCSFSSDGLSSSCFNWTDPDYIQCPSGDCLHDCKNVSLLYQPPSMDANGGSNYDVCLGLPVLYGYHTQDLIPSNVMSQINPSLSNATSNDMMAITDAVTHCLLSTCDQARDSSICKAACSSTSLLINSTTPSMEGINACLVTLCGSSPLTSALPFANADIAGIGVSDHDRGAKSELTDIV